MNTGTTSQDILWKFSPKGKNYALVLRGPNGNEVEQAVNRRDHKELVKNSANLVSFMELYAPPILDRTVTTPISVFASLHKLTQDHFRSAAKVQEEWVQLAMVRFYQSHASASAAEAERVARILQSIPEAQHALEAHSLNTHVSVQKVTLDQWLDTFDYIVNGKLDQSYADFNRKHSGRVFRFATASLVEQYTATNIYRNDDLQLRGTNISSIMHRFIQLARRSRKLEDKLYAMPLQKILQALDFHIPGTLLVVDTFELIDSLKHVKFRGPMKRNNAYAYGPNLESHFGKTLSNRIEKEGLTDRVSKFLTYSYKGNLILDAAGGYGAAHGYVPFMVHSMRKLGVKETVEILETIENETDGVTMRGFMELVRRGGFTGPEPAAWTAVLLANK